MIEFDGLMAVKFSIGRKGLCARGDDGEFMRMPAVKETVWSTMQTENHLKRWTNLLWWFTFDALKLWATLYVPPSIFSHTQNNIFIFLHCDGNFFFLDVIKSTTHHTVIYESQTLFEVPSMIISFVVEIWLVGGAVKNQSLRVIN